MPLCERVSRVWNASRMRGGERRMSGRCEPDTGETPRLGSPPHRALLHSLRTSCAHSRMRPCQPGARSRPETRLEASAAGETDSGGGDLNGCVTLALQAVEIEDASGAASWPQSSCYRPVTARPSIGRPMRSRPPPGHPRAERPDVLALGDVTEETRLCLLAGASVSALPRSDRC